jgi:chloramphenicol-sensitive protein RarD
MDRPKTTPRYPGDDTGHDLSRIRTGTLAGGAAYAIWGVFPLYFSRLKRIGAFELAGWRLVLTTIVVWVLLAARKDLSWVSEIRTDRKRVALVGAAGILVTINWFIFVWATHNGHVVDAAIGYFITPLLSVGLGVVVLNEHLRKLQTLAIALGAAAVLVLTIAYGRIPLVALSLAISFSLYGYCKKQAGLDGIRSLAGETLMVVPIGIALLVYLRLHSGLDITHVPAITIALGLGSGIVTAIPLMLFGVAAARVPLTTIGLLQYITPVLQLLCGVLVLGEHVSPARWAGIALVCCALGLLAVDLSGGPARRLVLD